jgi:hypothetical protein
MEIIEQTGGTFKGRFIWQESDDEDRFTGVVHGNQISFAYCDSASFGKTVSLGLFMGIRFHLPIVTVLHLEKFKEN